MSLVILKGLLIIGVVMVVFFGAALLIALVICNFDPGDGEQQGDDESAATERLIRK